MKSLYSKEMNYIIMCIRCTNYTIKIINLESHLLIRVVYAIVDVSVREHASSGIIAFSSINVSCSK